MWGGLIAVVLVASLAGPASAAWTAPLNLSGSGRDAFEPAVAVDANGNAVLTWSRYDGTTWRLQSRVRFANGTLGSVQTLSPPGVSASGSDVAVDPDGDAVIVWESVVPNSGLGLQVQARTRFANGTLSPIQTLSAANNLVGRSNPRVAVDADGDAVVVWESGDSNLTIQARARSAGGVLSPIQTLATQACCSQVAVDANGDAVFAWHKYGTPNRVQARARSAGGILSPVQALSPIGQTAHFPYVAVDADGDAVFAWEGHDGTTWRIQARARSAAGTLSPVQWLSSVGRQASSPQVAVDADGDAVFTWQQLIGDISVSADSQWAAYARARSAAGILSSIQGLSAPAAQLDAQEGRPEPRVAVDADGDAVFLWKRFDGTNVRVQARARSAGGTLSPVQTLSAAGQDVYRGHDIATDTDGDAVATWRRFDGTNWRIQAAAFDAGGGTPAPTITSFTPISGNIGTSVTVNGTNLTGATAVRFNGTNATFTVNPTGTQINTTVPSGATDGPISVTTAGGTATSSTNFDVTGPPPNPNLLTNPGFESDRTGWQGWTTGVSITTTNPKSGLKALKIAANGTFQSVDQIVAGTANRAYKLCTWQRTENLSGGSGADVRLHFLASDGTTVLLNTGTPADLIGTNPWTERCVTATAPQGTTQVRVRPRSNTHTTGFTYYDDVSLVQV